MKSKWIVYLLAVSFSLALAETVHAQQTPQAVASPVVADGNAVLSYWTAARMANATPLDLPVATGNEGADNFTTSTANEPVVMQPSAVPASEQNSAPQDSSNPEMDPAPPPLGYTYPFPFTRFDVVPLLYAPTIVPNAVNINATFPYRTVGKVFFTKDTGGNFVCSASVIANHLLLTARHCIYNTTTGNFYTNVMFAPGYFNRDNPNLGGRWSYRRLHTWANPAPNWRYDIGFIQLFDNDGRGCGGSQGGRPIESFTGHLGFFYGGSYDQVEWNEFGYPAAGMFNGQVMVEADSSTGVVGGGGAWNDTIQVGNDMTGGSSGGPWIRHMFPNQFGNLQNLANGLNSFAPAGRPSATGGPAFFKYNFGDLYASATALPCP